MRNFKQQFGLLSFSFFMIILSCTACPLNDGDPLPLPYTGPVSFSFAQEVIGFHSFSAQITATDHATTGTMIVSESPTAPALATLNNDAKIVRHFAKGTTRKITLSWNEHFTQAALQTAVTASGTDHVLHVLNRGTYANWYLKADTDYHLYIYYNGRTFDHPFHTPQDIGVGPAQIRYVTAYNLIFGRTGPILTDLVTAHTLEVKSTETLAVPIMIALMGGATGTTTTFNIDGSPAGGCARSFPPSCNAPSGRLLISFEDADHPTALIFFEGIYFSIAHFNQLKQTIGTTTQTTTVTNVTS